VIEVTGDQFTRTVHIAGGYTVPTTAIARVDQNGVHLPNPAAMYLSQLHAHEEAEEEAAVQDETGRAPRFVPDPQDLQDEHRLAGH
jgi:hypothetical protein